MTSVDRIQHHQSQREKQDQRHQQEHEQEQQEQQSVKAKLLARRDLPPQGRQDHTSQPSTGSGGAASAPPQRPPAARAPADRPPPQSRCEGKAAAARAAAAAETSARGRERSRSTQSNSSSESGSASASSPPPSRQRISPPPPRQRTVAPAPQRRPTVQAASAKSQSRPAPAALAVPSAARKQQRQQARPIGLSPATARIFANYPPSLTSQPPPPALASAGNGRHRAPQPTARARSAYPLGGTHPTGEQLALDGDLFRGQADWPRSTYAPAGPAFPCPNSSLGAATGPHHILPHPVFEEDCQQIVRVPYLVWRAVAGIGWTKCHATYLEELLLKGAYPR